MAQTFATQRYCTITHFAQVSEDSVLVLHVHTLPENEDGSGNTATRPSSLGLPSPFSWLEERHMQELMVMVHEVAFAKVVQRLSETEPAAKSASAGKPDFQLKRGRKLRVLFSFRAHQVSQHITLPTDPSASPLLVPSCGTFVTAQGRTVFESTGISTAGSGFRSFRTVLDTLHVFVDSYDPTSPEGVIKILMLLDPDRRQSHDIMAYFPPRPQQEGSSSEGEGEGGLLAELPVAGLKRRRRGGGMGAGRGRGRSTSGKASGDEKSSKTNPREKKPRHDRTRSHQQPTIAQSLASVTEHCAPPHPPLSLQRRKGAVPAKTRSLSTTSIDDLFGMGSDWLSSDSEATGPGLAGSRSGTVTSPACSGTGTLTSASSSGGGDVGNAAGDTASPEVFSPCSIVSYSTPSLTTPDVDATPPSLTARDMDAAPVPSPCPQSQYCPPSTASKSTPDNKVTSQDRAAHSVESSGRKLSLKLRKGESPSAPNSCVCVELDCKNQLPQQDCENQLPRQDCENQLPRQDCENQLPRQDCENQLPRQDCENQLPRQDCENQLPRQDCENQLPRQDCENQLPRQDCENQLPRQDCENQLPRQDCENQLPRQDQLPRQVGSPHTEQVYHVVDSGTDSEESTQDEEDLPSLFFETDRFGYPKSSRVVEERRMDTGEANSHALSSASLLTSHNMENSPEDLSCCSNSETQGSQPFLDITNTTVPDHSRKSGGSLQCFQGKGLQTAAPTDTSLRSTPPRDMENRHLPEAQLQGMAEAACTIDLTGEVSIVLSSGEEESVCFSQPQGGSQSSQPRDAHSPGSRQSSSRQDSVRGEPGQPKKKKISLQVLFKGAKELRDVPERSVQYWLAQQKRLLLDIFQRKIYSRRHQDYITNPKKRAALHHQVSTHLFTSEQINVITRGLMNAFCHNDMKYFSYVMSVLYPESLIRLIMAFHSIPFDQAEEMMFGYEVEEEEEEEEVESDF